MTAAADAAAFLVQVNHTLSYGLELQVGKTLQLSPTTLLIPRAGGFIELWEIDAGPPTVVPSTEHTRAGVLGGADLMLRFGEQSLFYGRLGADLRIGGDADGGGLVIGAGVWAGLGILL
jgi:hypothetical protein